RIVTAGDPHFSAGAILVGKIAPGVSSGVTSGCNGVKAPQLLSGLGVVSAKETFFFLISLAVAEALEHFAVNNERTAGVVIALCNFSIPSHFSVAGIKCFYAVAARKIEFVLIKRYTAHRDISAQMVFPNDFAGGAIDRLDDSARVCEINDPIVDNRRWLVRA